MWIRLECRFTRTAIRDNSGGENAVIYLVKNSKNQIIENLLILDSAFFVYCIYSRFDVSTFEFETGVEHCVNGSLDGLSLHRHKIDERVIEIEYDGLDQWSKE